MNGSMSMFIFAFTVFLLSVCLLNFNRVNSAKQAMCLIKVAFVSCLMLYYVPVQAQSDWVGWPSADTADGKFLAVTGPQSAIEYVPPEIIIGIPSTATQFEIELFDGDASAMLTSRYDINTSGSGFTYTLYEDPDKDGTGTTVLQTRDDTEFVNDDWSSYVANQAVSVSAQGEGGLYWYRLLFEFNGNPDTEQFFNALKVRVRSDSGIDARVGALKRVIIGASPINPVLDPGLGSADNSYGGDWLFDVEVTEAGVPAIEFADSDADFSGDLSAPGEPPDDNINRPSFRISPSIRYELFTPDGEFITLNSDPSGTEEEESYVYTPPANSPAGFYRWHWFGVDASNVFVLRTDYIIYTVNDEQFATLGNYVWLDENADGLQDAGEPGLAGVRVMLKDAIGSVVSSRITGAAGGYLFDRLVPGRYTVEIDASSLPAGITQTLNPVLGGADLGNQSIPYSVDLNPGDVNLTADFGFVYGDPDGNQGPGALGDKVWIDTNGNGIQDAGEAGLGGVDLTIYTDTNGDGVIEPGVDAAFTDAVDQDGTTGSGQTTTRADGSYLFNELPADAYVVVVDASTLPVGFTQTADPDEFGAPATVADNQTTTPVILGPGDVFLNVDFGYQPESAVVNTIGDTVFLDINANGSQDAGEPGIGDVSLSLLNAAGDPIAYQMTDSNGMYLFEGLPDGDYSVWVTDEKGILSILKPSADPDSKLDGRSSVSVAGGESNLDQDYGYITAMHGSGDGLIGDTIFLDRDADGEADAGEGLGFVKVQLYDVTGTALVAETITNADGLYLFGGLDPSASYTVKVDTATLPAGLVNTVDPDGGNDSESSINLSLDPDGSNDGINLDQDFGYVIDTSTQTPGTIGDTVWLDVNADGINAGALGADGIAGTADDEPGIEGISLDLYLDSNGDGELQSGEPRMNSVVTDSTGKYLFDQLLAGDYIVDVSDSSGLLNGYWHSLGASDTNDHSQSDPYAVSLPNGGAVETADFGYYHDLAGVGNYVWFDANSNGLQDAGEPGIVDVEVELTITYPDGSQSILRTMTDAAGMYTFGNLLGDEDYNGDSSDGSAEPVFTIRVDTPNGLTASPVDQGGDDAVDSDNGAGELAQPVMGGVDDSNDFGFYQISLGSISGNVSSDMDLDGSGQPDPLVGVILSLYPDQNKDGVPDTNTPIQLTITNAEGDYLFTGIEPGDYVVEETDPDGYTSVSDGDSSPDVGEDAPNEDPNDNRIPVSVGTNPTTLAVENDGNNNFVDTSPLAGLGDTVWFDHNFDGIKNAGESGIEGVSVILTDSNSNAVDTMVTDADGLYRITGLLPGDYKVEVDSSTLPQSVVQTYDLDDGVSANPVTINAATVTLAAGDSNNEVDFGYRPLGSLGDTVWNDSNANGILDAGETGIAGVTVTLTGAVSATTTTDANGEYTFTDLPIGTYTVSVSGSALDDFEPTHDLDDPMTTTPITANTADVELVLTSSGDAVESRDDVDFGYYQQLSSITGTVLEDSTGDNAGDRALRDNNGDPVTVMLTLYKADASGNPVGQSLAMTTANTTTGVYRFTDLPPGDYVVIQSQPSGYNSIADHDASADGDSFDSDTTVDDRIAVTIMPGESEDDGNNFVEQRLASIGGWVSLDTTGNGFGDTVLSGVELELLDSNGNVVATAITSMDGGYSFNGLVAGDYTVVQLQPAGYFSVKDQDFETASVGDPDPQDADETVDNKVGVNLKPGEKDKGNSFIEFTSPASIDIRKQAEGDDVRTFALGDTVEFEIQVTNTGAVDLNNVNVSDPLLPACDNLIGQLGVNDSVSYSCSMVVDSAQGFVNVASVSGEVNGQTVTDSDASEVLIEEACECANGQQLVTLQIVEWNHARDENETVRVREGGLGGTLLFEDKVENNGLFTFNVNNPGATIVVTVEGIHHLSESVKGKFETNCNLVLNETSGNSYVTFNVTELENDVDDEVCPSPMENLQSSLYPSLSH